MDIMQVKDLTFIHNERKRWLKRPEVFQLGPVNLSVKRGETIAIIGEPHEIAPLALKKYNGLLNRINFYLPFELTISQEPMMQWWEKTIGFIKST